MNDSTKLDLDNYLPYLVNRVGTIIADQWGGEQLAPYRLSIAMWRVMAVLASKGGQRQIDLADLTSIEVSTLSRLVTRLCAWASSRAPAPPAARAKSWSSLRPRARRRWRGWCRGTRLRGGRHRRRAAGRSRRREKRVAAHVCQYESAAAAASAPPPDRKPPAPTFGGGVTARVGPRRRYRRAPICAKAAERCDGDRRALRLLLPFVDHEDKGMMGVIEVVA